MKILIKTPILGTIIYIINNYVYSGDSRASNNFAPLNLWIKTLFLPFTIAIGLTATSLYPLIQDAINGNDLNFSRLSNIQKNPSEIIISIFPSLLGFGIGVYALIFALQASVINGMQQEIEKRSASGSRKYGSVLMINADMAYPLVVLTISLGVGIFQKIFESNSLLYATWFTFWYGMIVVLQVIGVLFSLGDSSILNKLEAPEE
ncbi:hypothetical protein [Comamonas sp. BIGb0124]|uniref:hypothetical protein n=1 Tax=Comamonas sp. BIGb0124 TaxID=2485130 RepID=UPI00131574B0|nr:hypothetical protein [Comamonas sp. BIGb0124]